MSCTSYVKTLNYFGRGIGCLYYVVSSVRFPRVIYLYSQMYTVDKSMNENFQIHIKNYVGMLPLPWEGFR